MSSKQRSSDVFKHALSTPGSNRSRRQARSLLNRVVRSTVDALEQRRLLVGNVDPVADTGGPYSVSEGSSVVIDGGDSTDSDGTIVAYAWDLNYKVSKGFRRGVSGQAFTFEATDGNATRTIALRVTDNDGATHISTTTVTINNVAPVLTMTGASSADEGQAYSLSWSASDAGEDTITGYSIDWGDGTDPTTHAANVSSATHTYTEDGSYTITLSATDEDGTHTQTKSITVNDVAPVINAELDEDEIDEGDQARVTYSSSNRAGSIDQWIIDWGDGTVNVRPGKSSASTHTYADDGTYTITVSALEPDGGVTDQTLTISVGNVTPEVEITGVPEESPEGTAITAGRTVSDVGDDTFSYLWTLKKGESTVATSTTSGNYTFTPTDNGDYTLTLTVTDDDGGESTDSVEFTVTNVSPIGAITPTLPNDLEEGETASFTVGVTDPGSADTFEYLWSVEKDGETYTLDENVDRESATFQFTFPDNGSYIVSVLVTDDDGGQHIASTSAIVIGNVAPTASISRTDNLNSPVEGDTLSFAAIALDAGSADTFTYTWSVTRGGQNFVLPNGTATDGSTFSFVPTDDGTYVVSLNVSDDDGDDVDASTVSVTVGNALPVINLSVEPGDLVEGSNISAAVNATDPGSEDTLTYLWEVTKDGSPLSLPGVSVDDPTFTFTPRDEGDYVITITVTDDDAGSISATSSTYVVDNAAPDVTISDEPDGALEGGTVSFTSNATDAGATDTLTYLWSVSRGGDPFSVAPGTTVDDDEFSFIPTDNGSYVVTLVVTDNDGAATTVSSSAFTVSNVNPLGTVSGEPNSAIDEGDSVTLTVAATDAGSEDTFTYFWMVELDGEAVSLPQGLNNTSNSFTYTTEDDGSYVISVLITDDDGGEHIASSNAITSNNVAPTASVTGGSDGEEEGVVQSFTVTPADVGAADTFSYAWTVTKDGQPYTLPQDVDTDNATFSFTPSDNGTYVASVVVTDDDGDNVSASSAAIGVINAAPVGSIIVDETGIEGSAIVAVANVTDPGSDDTFTYLWSVSKDGQPYTLPNGTVDDEAGFTFTPTDEGEYELSCVVTDDDAGTNILVATVDVSNAAPVPVITGGPASVTGEGSSVTLGSTVTDAGSADTVGTYAWSVTRDGATFDVSALTTNASTFTFTPTDNGAYVVTLTVTDNDGASGTTTKSFTVTNANPAATVATPGASTNQGSSVSYSVTAEDPGAEDILSYAWHVKRNGVDYTLPNNVVTTNSTFTFTPTLAGSYVVSVVVSDDDEGSTTVNKNLTVNNVAPVINSITGPTGSLNKNSELSYSASVTDPGSETLVYTWTVSRGGSVVSTHTGATLDYTPTVAGSYEVQLSVTDGIATDTDSVLFTAINHAPVISALNGVEDIDQGDTLVFSAETSDEDNDHVTRSWAISLGGDELLQSSSAELEFSPTVPGTYTLVLTVSDGSETDEETATFTVSNVAPQVGIVGVSEGAIEGSPVTVTGWAADAGLDALTLSWTITAEGSEEPVATGTSASITFTPTAPGAYTATFVANDGTADSNTASTTFDVANSVPTAAITAPENAGVIGWDQRFSISELEAYEGDTVTIDWDWGNGQTTLGADADAVQTRRYAATGTYTVTATVKDEDGGSTIVTKSFVVNDYGMQPNPFGSGQALIVVGTGSNDVISFQRLSNGKTRAVRNGVTLGSTFNPTHVIAQGEGGNDSITANNLNIPAVFYGGTGKDTLTGANSNDLLLGGKGNDSLSGGAGRDILIGESDSDVLLGSDGEDILIGANFASAGSNAELKAIADEWNDTGRSFADRVSRLRNGASGLTAYFASGKVVGDAKPDYLTGGGSSDWFFKDTTTAIDAIFDAGSSDRVDNVA